MAGKFEIYQDKAGEYRYRLKAGNGEIILASEGFKQIASARNAITSVQSNAPADARYERKGTPSGKHMFNLKAANGQVIGTSESYNSAEARENGIEKVKRSASDAALTYLTSITSEIAQLNRKQAQVDTARKKGFGLHFKREAEEIVLNGKGFALALARLFKNAEGEFSFALLGRWGSGKTSIASLVSGYLQEPASYQRDFRSTFGSDPGEKCDQLEYKTVQFNAWRYRQKPELWVYLYESFLTEYLNCGWIEKVLKTARVNIRKIGVFQALFELLLLALTAFPLMWISLVFPFSQAVFGVAGSFGLVLLAHRWYGSLRRLYDQYGVIKSHREHLGMQAVIGLDLQRLVASWGKSDDFNPWEKNTLGIVTSLVSLIWLSTFFRFNWDDTIFLGFSVNYSFGIASVAGWMIWSVAGAVFFSSVVCKTGRVDRILLVIDDLDRCPQEEIVDLIDGIKLMTDDETIGKVVQALVLADDTILDAAIRKRFKDLADDKGDTRKIEAIREHMEKVFLCHAHLPKLTSNNVADLVSVYSQEFGLEALKADDDEVRVSSSKGERGEMNSNHDRQRPIELHTDFVITLEERNAIRTALTYAFEGAESPMTPRFVRSFLYKYQLVRMLLQLNAVEFDTSDLAHSLVQAALWIRSSDKPWEPENASSTTDFIRMVA